MRNKIWFMVLVLGLIASAAGAALSFVYGKTAPIIENRILTQKIKPTLDRFYGPLNVNNDYIADNVTLDLGKDDWGRKLTANVFRGKKNSKIVAVALQTTAGGFGGDISVLSAFDLQSETIIGVKALDQKETKGLGSRIADDTEPFIQQFQNMPFTTAIKLKTNGGQVDAISGATISSKGFTTAVDKARILLDEKRTEILAKGETK